MNLRIFEARYLDMIKTCLRNKSGFVIVATSQGTNSNKSNLLPFASVGTVLEILDADVTTVGLILIKCRGRHRVNIKDFTTNPDGLLIGEVLDIDNDLQIPIPDDLKILSKNLQTLIESLQVNGISESDIPIFKPYEYNDAAWVSNRWVELLDLPLIQKQRLMEVNSPIMRLELIHDALN